MTPLEELERRHGAFVQSTALRLKVPEPALRDLTLKVLREEQRRPEASLPEPPHVVEARLAALVRRQRLDDIARAHFKTVWNLARRLGCPPADQDDLVADVFEQITRNLERFMGPEEALKGWLCGYTVNVWRNRRRGRLRQSRREGPPDLQPDELPSPGAASVEDTLVERLRLERLLAWLLDQLDPSLREAWVLQELEGLTQKEIAAALEIPPGTAASRVRRAKERVEEVLEAQYRRRAVPLPIALAGASSPSALDALLRRVIDHERQRDDAPPEARERILERVRRDVFERDPEPPPAGGPGRVGRLLSRGRVAERLALLFAGATAGAALHAGYAPRPTPPATALVATPATVPAGALDEPPRTEAAGPTVAMAVVPAAAAAARAHPAPRAQADPRRTATPRRPPPPAAPHPPRATPVAPSTLPEERRLLQTAQAALRGDLPRDALRALDEHAARFPDGQLAEQREGLRVGALAAAGRASEARARAARFRRDHPDSIYQPAVDEALATLP